MVQPEHPVGLPATLPQPAIADAPAIPNDRDIVVGVNRDHSIAINQEAVAVEHLEQRLRVIFAARANKVILCADIAISIFGRSRGHRPG